MREMLDREERQRMRDMKAQRERKREREGEEGGREGAIHCSLTHYLYPVSWSRQSHLNLHELMADSDPFYTPEFSTGA